MKNNIEKILVGKKKLWIQPDIPFGLLEIDFLDCLSKNLLLNKKAKSFTDVISFAFWCRRKNILNIKKNIYSNEVRVGLGSLFHITPSNVPLNFAYSFVFGFLMGNSNLVKIPSQNFLQTKIVCDEIKKIMKINKFKIFEKKNFFFKYDSKDINFTKKISSQVDGRIIWGGDSTVNELKILKTKPRTKDIFFADRFSLSVIESKKIMKCNQKDLTAIAQKFYNDGYFMDQNACSSPRIIIWYGKNNDNKLAKQKFWPQIYKIVKKKYSLEKTNAVEKYTTLCEFAGKSKESINYNNFENLVYRIELKKININYINLKNKFGYFYELNCNKLEHIKNLITEKLQTISYFGLKKDEIKNFVLKYKFRGVDRIVPIGCSHEISFIWDGYNIDKQLTRVIEIR